MLSLLMFVGILFTYKSRFAQLRLLPDALTCFWNKLKERNHNNGVTSGYRALCTALAATVGTGNIAGVAGAIALGGPGVVFWIWVSGILGMVTKFAEVTLALSYRGKDNSNQYVGGPMYMIKNGLPDRIKFLASAYCILGVIASFGVGNAAQVNAMIDGIRCMMEISGRPLSGIQTLLICVLLSFLITYAFRRGTAGIGCCAEKLVPFASVAYMSLAVCVICFCYKEIPSVIGTILVSAFEPRAVTGGVISSAFISLRIGISRGIFTNEAGMGTASIAHSSAETKDPIEQGLLGMIEVFFDTIILCTLTALVILCSGVPTSYGSDPGILLTLQAFSSVLGDWAIGVITFLVCIFAFATVLGWGFYGIQFAQFLFGHNILRIYVAVEALVCFTAGLTNTSFVWILSELFNGLMAIPNLIALMWLAPVFLTQINEYKQARR